MKHGLAALVALLLAAPVSAEAWKIGEPAPAFTMRTFDGKDIALADMRGKVVVLNFWATWCAPCRRELPLLSRYYTLRHDAGLEMVAVTYEDDMPIARLKKVAAIVAFPMGRQFRGDYGKVKALPMNFVIDRAGILRYAKAGAFDLTGLNEILIPLMQAPVPPAATVAVAAPPLAP